MIRLHELREKRGLSMKDVAKALEIPYTTYVNYEKGVREPNFEALFRLADFFGMPIDDLLGRCAPNEPLTLEELRGMANKPYWHVGLREESAAPHWSILDPLLAYHPEDYDYGEGWLAYRRPPEGEA